MKEELLFRFLTKTCTGDDLRKIDELIAEDKANAAYFFDMEHIWSLKNELRYSSEKEIETAYLSFCLSVDEKEKEKDKATPARWRSKTPIRRIMAYAASALIAGILLFLYFNDRPEDAIMAENKIEVPSGERVSLTLSDGTKVWLNAQSSISYPSGFSKKDRRVFLEGEGYFEVAHDAGKPFIVETPSLSIKVLGTRFNLKAYREEPASVSLQEGKIEVHIDEQHPNLVLSPMDELQYSSETGLKIVKRTDIARTSNWIRGELYFSGEKLEDIARVLTRRFGVNILIRDKNLESQRFSCRIHPGASLIHVMDLLKETREMDYFMDKSNSVCIVAPR